MTMTPTSSDSTAQPQSHPAGPRLFRALRHRNYKLFFSGQIVSLVGSFLTMTATAWLVERLTHSPRMLGVVAFASQIPIFLLSPFAGVWVDRVKKRRLLVITQTLAMLESFALAYLALSGRITVGEIIALNIFQGLINAFDIPGRQAFLVEMVTDRGDLANAIALNSTMVHTARILGPAVAGMLIWFVGEGLCFTIDGISYIGVIIALMAMTLSPRPTRAARSVLSELKEGFVYVWNHVPIRVLLLTLAAISLTGMPALSLLLPVYGEHFGGSSSHGAAIFTLLGSASGVGALTGALLLANRRSVLGLGRMIGVATTVFGISLVVFGAAPWLWLNLLIIPIAGWGMITLFAGANTLLQTMADDDKRGRVMSFFSMAFIGVTPFGAWLAGELATRMTPLGQQAVVGASRTLLLEGTLCAAAGLIFAANLNALRKLIRPIYLKKGILPRDVIPEVADGLQAAAQMTEAGEE